MTDSKEFTERLSKIHKWYPLSLGMVWKKSDQYRVVKQDLSWREVDHTDLSDTTIIEAYEGRRPIPESVRRSEVWWSLLYDICQTHISLGPLYDILSDWGWYIDKTEEYKHKYVDIEKAKDAAEMHLRSFFSNFTEEEILLLGGKREIMKNMEQGPNVLMTWLLK